MNAIEKRKAEELCLILVLNMWYKVEYEYWYKCMFSLLFFNILELDWELYKQNLTV